jgi:hypothetical protein
MSNLLKRGLVILMVMAATVSRADEVKDRLLDKGELAPFPEAKPFMIDLAAVIDSSELKTAIGGSRTLQMLRERVRTKIFHLNFVFNITEERYPYTPPFEAPFPFRPTLEVMEMAQKFLAAVEQYTGFKTPMKDRIASYPYFSYLGLFFPEATRQTITRVVDRAQMAEEPVEAYDTFLARKEAYGESASFPEFAESVNVLLLEFKSKEIRDTRKVDPVFDQYCQESIDELKSLQKLRGQPQSRLYGAHTGAYPYRKTIQASERAVLLFDLHERLKYPEGVNWHDVEISWFVGNSPKLLALYHYNRYQYQMAGLLADPEVILLPFTGGASFEYLNRLRVVPIGIFDVAVRTDRIDRHHNSPLDNLYHDINHVRRMWGYDQRKQERRGARTRAEKFAIYREQDAFMKKLLAEIDPKAVKNDPGEVNLRRYENVYLFETGHETALTPDPESLLYDLLRKPATPQPFEVQMQAVIDNLEQIRSFDGNLRSGADQLRLNLERPTTINYFYDRAPGYLANVDNKLRWGFFDSVFKMRNYVVAERYRRPLFGAQAALRLFARLGYKNPPSVEELTRQMTTHSGQPELWNYFSTADTGVVRLSGLNMLNVTAGDEIHNTWRRNSLYADRWKPTNAKLIDGSTVNDEWSLQRYFEERGIPEYLRPFYRLDHDPVIQETVLYEDIRNLPNEILAPNHQGENLMSGAKAVSVVDRIWHKNLHFASLDSVERFLVAASQTVHQAVLDRNANGARNNPTYNQHWIGLPAQNKINDLDLVRIAFESRLKVPGKKLPAETVTIFQEGMARLYGKIKRGEPIRCHVLLPTMDAAAGTND